LLFIIVELDDLADMYLIEFHSKQKEKREREREKDLSSFVNLDHLYRNIVIRKHWTKEQREREREKSYESILSRCLFRFLAFVTGFPLGFVLYIYSFYSIVEKQKKKKIFFRRAL